MTATKTTPSRQIEISIRDKDFTLAFPNTQGIWNMEILKASLSRNTYDTLNATNTDAANYAKFSIDMVAVFTVMCPEIKEHLKVKSFAELEIQDSNELMKVYIKKVLPWLREWEEILQTPFIKDEDDEVKK